VNQNLSLSVGQATTSGIKPINQDFLDFQIPQDPVLSFKGACFVMADGISSSQVSQVASEASVQAFIEDYYCTPDAWSIESSVNKVTKSVNTWLYAQTQNSPFKYNKDKGYVCTFSALVITPQDAHIFNVGDTRIYHLAGGKLNQLSTDHRKVISSEQSYLSRAMGVQQTLEVDHTCIEIHQGDYFIQATDGVYEFISQADIMDAINRYSKLQSAADYLVKLALDKGSNDNLSIQIIRVNQLNQKAILKKQGDISNLQLPPALKPRVEFDGFEIVRQVYISSRSHVYLAIDLQTQKKVALKVPSTEQATDKLYLERFMLEDWIAKKVNHPNVVKGIKTDSQKQYLYIATEFVEGQNLDQWIRDNPKPRLNQVRQIVNQIADGLQAFHRNEMVHQDLRPHNIMIDDNNTVKIIDFGSTYIAGVTDVETQEVMRGTLRYSAPEYFLGQVGTQRSDIYSLGVIAYQMLSGKFPYSNQISQAHSRKAQDRYKYKSLLTEESEIPAWVDDALAKALAKDPWKRYSELSEFIYDLHHPNKNFLNKTRPPLIERDPVMFWQAVSAILFMALIAQYL